MKHKNNFVIFFFITGVLFLGMIYYIVKRESDSFLATAAAWIGSKLEGFDASPPPAIRCPENWKFFANSGGAGFCCGAEVNPYGGSCSDPEKLCALAPNMPDPRGPSFGFLRLCQ
jgi:hypothetical protein